MVYLVFALIMLISLASESFGSTGGTAEGVGAVIGIIIGMVVIMVRLCWDLFFVTSKDMMPTFLGAALFLHEKIASTTVVAATKDDVMNFGKYNWF